MNRKYGRPYLVGQVWDLELVPGEVAQAAEASTLMRTP
jgi:hypothetical protein